MSLSAMYEEKSEDLLSAFRTFLLRNIREYSFVENRKNHLKISSRLFLPTFRMGS
jgi:hypothetical protein